MRIHKGRTILLSIMLVLTSSVLLVVLKTNICISLKKRTKPNNNKLLAKQILVFPHNNLYPNAQPDLFFTGNAKDACNLKFDCNFFTGLNSSYTRSLEQYDAILVGKGRAIEQFSKIVNQKQYLQRRSGNQIWGFWAMESAKNPVTSSNLKKSQLNSSFNWTIFASKKATIYRPYFKVIDKFEDVNEKEKQLDFRSKNKNICWIVSNCAADFSKRTEFAIKLIKKLSFKTHIWGKASNRCLSSARNKLINHGPLPGHLRDHYYGIQAVISDCRLYLAFENSVCSEYISEKFVNSLEAGAIPIVNGWRSSYEEKINNSFVHILDFQSIDSLAIYLEELVKNESIWLQYQQWRSIKHIEKIGLEINCKICQKLTLIGPNTNGNNMNTFIDLEEHLKSLQECL